MAVVVTLTKLMDRKAANSMTGNSKTAISASVAANSALQPFMLLCRFGPGAGLSIPRQTFVRCGQIGGWVLNGRELCADRLRPCSLRRTRSRRDFDAGRPLELRQQLLVCATESARHQNLQLR
jgi:hypothetical protein